MTVSELMAKLSNYGVDPKILLHLEEFLDTYIEYNLKIPKFVYYFRDHKDLVIHIESSELGNNTYSFDSLNRISTDVSKRTGWINYNWKVRPTNVRDVLILDDSIL